MGKKKKFRFPPYDTLIGKGTQIEGNLRFVGGLHIDGHILGNVIAGIAPTGEAAVTLSATGVIQGNLESPYVVLDGRVEGDVHASERALLAAGARILGTLYYGALTIDAGAQVQGGLVCLDQSVNASADPLTADG
ncbi:MAG: polymer-forming cytoskeletal protein [Gammaproteobacteria bacterium]|jgi:cytoskeletal protein CcmA (bactofilin family)|nr:polymer-forming cytoskeletal protein [Gammaproteobacteria bacterium]